MKKLLQTTGLIFALLLLANVGMAQTYTFSPANDATGVSTSPTLTITFDEDVELVKNGMIYLADETWEEEYRFSTGSGKNSTPAVGLSVLGDKLILNLEEASLTLGENTKYAVFFDEDAIKVGGVFWNDLYDEDYVTSIWSFTTGAAPIIPIVTSFTPANNSTGTSINTSLSIVFDNNITLGSGNFKVKAGVTEVASFSTTDPEVSVVSGSQLAIDLSGLTLDYNTEYHIEMDAEFILNFAGFTGSSGWSFTTETTPINYTLTPANAAIEVSTSPTLIITFDDVVTLESGKGLYLKNESGDNVEQFSTGIIGWVPFDERLIISGNTLTIDLSNSVLSGNANFFVAVDEGVIKVGGVVWDELNDLNYGTSIWSFTTGASPVDPGAPIIVSLTPPKNTTDVSVTPTLILEFDRDITKGSSGQFKIKFGSSDAGIYSTSSGQVSILDNKLTVNAADLDYNTTYHVEIDPGFIQNFAGISDPTFWTFTTESKPPQWADNYPTITQSSTGFTFKGKSDLTGKYYFVVTGSLTPPNKEQIKAGKNSSGGNALESFNEEMIGNDEFTKTIDYGTNFPAGSYFLHTLVATDDGKNGEVKTLLIDRTPPSINNASYPINNFELFPVADSILIIFSEKVFNYNGGVTKLTSASFILKTKNEGTPVLFDFKVSEDGTEVTLTPTPPLSGNTEYVVEIKSISDAYHNVMNAVTRTFHTDKLNVWNGAGSTTLWSDAENWENGSYVPGKSVLIPNSLTNNYPVINSDITVNNLTIEAGAVVTQTGGVITVLGDFDLLSSEVTNASYLPEGGSLDVKGETRVHQHIVPGKGLIDYLMGPPTDGTNYANFGTPYLIKYYENPTDSWVSIGTTNMLLGVGYAVYSLNDLIFRGNINRNSIEVPLQRTNGKGYGWNLLGNPYTASINWGDLDVDTSKVENNYWMWDTKNRVYGAFNQEAGIGLDLDGEIPSNHGFLVKLKIGQTTSGTFSFAPSAMVVNTKNYLKSTTKSKPPYIKISAGNSEFIDQFAVAFIPDASDGVDKYDTEKFFGSGNPFQIFTVEGDTKLSINSLPDVGEETTINLGYQSSKAGSYTIRLKEDNLEHSEVILTDTKEGVSVDLLYEGSYTFNVNKKESNNTRFTLTFPANIPTSVAKDVPTDNMNIYLKEGDVIVDVRGEAESLTYEMVGVTGNIVGRGNLHSGVNNLGKFPSGLFIINIRNGVETFVSKKLLVTH